jgi:Ca2+-binding EF-hand superfamily protein
VLHSKVGSSAFGLFALLIFDKGKKFYDLWARTMAPDQKDMFREAFKVFDRDGNGKISADELR